MGLTKSTLFTDKQNEISRYAKVFAHPARIAIIEYLLKSNTCINGDLVNEIGLAQATISQHLRELKEVGIIQGTIEGVSVSYCIDQNKWEEIRIMFEELLRSFQDNQNTPKDSCC